jgi:hypothetical protein
MSPALPPSCSHHGGPRADRAPQTPRFASGALGTPRVPAPAVASELRTAPALAEPPRCTGPWAWRRRPGRVIVPVALMLLVSALVAVFWTGGVPSGWWPQIGSVFTAETEPGAGSRAQDDPCDLIVGPAADYCRGGHHGPKPASPAGSHHARVASTVLAVGALTAGFGAVVVLRRRP